MGTPQRFDPLTLTPQPNGRARRVGLSVVEAFDRLRSRWRARPAAAQPCHRSGTRVQCPFDASVEVAWHEVLYQPVRCLYVLPPSGGRTPSLTLPDGPAADALLLEAGITWEHAWFPDRAPWSSGWRAPPVCSTSAFPPGTRGSWAARLRRGSRTVDPAADHRQPTTVSCACASGLWEGPP